LATTCSQKIFIGRRGGGSEDKMEAIKQRERKREREKRGRKRER
jgi:hypothetical protein